MSETNEQGKNTVKSTRRSIFMPDDLWARVQAEGERQERSASYIIKAAIKAYCVHADGAGKEAAK
jgi:predicted transcriptional regulator